jgi:hypothetical protein
MKYGDGTECFETLTFKLQTSGNKPKESTRHSKHGENFISRKLRVPDLHFIENHCS